MSAYIDVLKNDTIDYRATLCSAEIHPEIVDDIQALRRRLFVDRLGWTLNVDGAREIDQFDTADAVHCGIYKGPDLVGCFRAIPTDRPYLSRNVFPQLATSYAYPQSRDIWEISRLGYLTEAGPDAGRIVYAAMFGFARLVEAKSLVALVDLCHERLLRRLGIRTRRYGPPQRIGTDRTGRSLTAVAGEIPLDDQAEGYRELMSLLECMEMDDAAHVLRSEAVSA